jgi:DNA-directed RNA polymerase alpha subunit
MARGWESKSVEAQQADAGDKSDKTRLKLNPEAAARLRERETLRLSRKRVLQQLDVAQNPRHCQLLRDELADLDQKLSRLTD